MNNGASLRDRATQASPRAPAGLGHSVSIPSAWTWLHSLTLGLVVGTLITAILERLNV